MLSYKSLRERILIRRFSERGIGILMNAAPHNRSLRYLTVLRYR